MFVLGIDPGLSRCGYGLVGRGEGDSRCGPGRPGCSRRTPATPLAERLLELHIELRALIAELRPEVVVVERVFFQVNAKTAMSVGQASGLALLAAAEAGCEVAQYTANEVKQGLVGYGAATKEQVQRMVAQVLGLGAWRARPTWPMRWRWRVPPDHGAAAARRRRGLGGRRECEVIGLLRGPVVLRTGECEVIVDVAALATG